MKIVGEFACVFALWAMMVTPCAEAEQKLVTVVIGNIVPADSNENRIVKMLGATSFRTALTQWENQNADLKLSVRLERDRQIEVDKLIEDEQRRNTTLKAEVIKKLKDSSVKYFIFLQYAVIDKDRVRLSASLAKFQNDRALVIQAAEDTLDTKEEEFVSFISIGVQIYMALLKEEQLQFKPRTFPLVSCAGEKSLMANAFLSRIRSDLNRRRPWIVRELMDGSCAEEAPNRLRLTLDIEREKAQILMKVQVKYQDIIIAEASEGGTEEQLMGNLEDFIGRISRRLRNDCERWAPPS